MKRGRREEKETGPNGVQMRRAIGTGRAKEREKNETTKIRVTDKGEWSTRCLDEYRREVKVRGSDTYELLGGD